jgi:hypothetical protein
MKKFILPLLLILTVGMLAAVESEPSEVVGYVKYECLEGLNLIALPMNQGFANASDVGIALGSDTVSRFDASLQDWVSTYDDGTGIWPDDFSVSNGSVLMVYIYAPTSFYSIGSLYNTNASYNLLEGLNTAMIPLDQLSLTSGSLAGISMGSDTVSRFDPTLQDWVSTYDDGSGIWPDDFPLSIGSPFMAYSYNNQVWPAQRKNTIQKDSVSKRIK